ncbi:ligase-associated DNA damage response endonuclease PdeM [Luteimonas arsenica]|uniref:ligase-associated DNA damage response endonuclease PdeM n=1 Tax=Luteimonas arsenica TaxID=1586242 RepID=UPI0010549966|nr:ligase-associated DNA damage response endonuclease PdeM [Luteimonas arsenica]
MHAALDLELAGEHMQLMADRALYWPARGRLLIADLHLGKGDIMRAAGIAVPSGGTGHDLARLDALLRSTGARELWVLGDFLHGRRHARFETQWRRLLAAHPGCSAGVVAGNHDRALVPDAAGVVHLPEDVHDGPFRFRHHPLPAAGGEGGPGAGHVLCGHVHPVAALPGLPGRWPALVLEPGQTILPAFSAFTGGRLLDDRQAWIACAHGEFAGHRDAPWRRAPP